MTRVAVIGNGGGGKSTMCRQLSRALNIPCYTIDKIQWKPGWQRTPEEDIFREYQDGPEGSPLLPVTFRMFRTIHAVHYTMRPWLLETLASFKDGKDIIHIHSPREMQVFINQHCKP